MRRRAIGGASDEWFEINSRYNQLLNTSPCDQRGERFAWADVGTCAESKQVSVLPKNVEDFRVWIGRWITIGGGQNDENNVTRFHFLACNMSILSEEAPCVLN